MTSPILNEYLRQLNDETHKMRFQELFSWMESTFDALHVEVKWNQPMFILNQTFIIAFSPAKKHLSVAPEHACLNHFEAEIETLGFKRSKELLMIPWEKDIPYELLHDMIAFNIQEKAGMSQFWR